MLTSTRLSCVKWIEYQQKLYTNSRPHLQTFFQQSADLLPPGSCRLGSTPSCSPPWESHLMHPSFFQHTSATSSFPPLQHWSNTPHHSILFTDPSRFNAGKMKSADEFVVLISQNCLSSCRERCCSQSEMLHCLGLRQNSVRAEWDRSPFWGTKDVQ